MLIQLLTGYYIYSSASLADNPDGPRVFHRFFSSPRAPQHAMRFSQTSPTTKYTPIIPAIPTSWYSPFHLIPQITPSVHPNVADNVRKRMGECRIVVNLAHGAQYSSSRHRLRHNPVWCELVCVNDIHRFTLPVFCHAISKSGILVHIHNVIPIDPVRLW
jgi:hypothetical protein